MFYRYGYFCQGRHLYLGQRLTSNLKSVSGSDTELDSTRYRNTNDETITRLDSIRLDSILRVPTKC